MTEPATTLDERRAIRRAAALLIHASRDDGQGVHEVLCALTPLEVVHLLGAVMGIYSRLLPEEVHAQVIAALETHIPRFIAAEHDPAR